MKRIALLGALALALVAPLAGCAAVDKAISNAGNALAGTIDTSSAAILAVDNSFKAAQANGSVAALQAGVQADVCSVADAAATVASQTKAVGNSGHGTTVAVRDATDVYVVASTFCVQAGGKVIGVQPVPASAISTGT